MRKFRTTHNVICVSAGYYEPAINEASTPDTLIKSSLSDVANLELRRETDENERHGREEASTIYDLGCFSNMPLSFEKAQPQHFAFAFAYGFGNTATGAYGTGFKHTFIPIQGDFDYDRSLPSFTADMRFGDSVFKRRFYSMFVDSITAKFSRDAFCKLDLGIKGTGKHLSDIEECVVSAYDDAEFVVIPFLTQGGSDPKDCIHSVEAIYNYDNIKIVQVLDVATSGNDTAIAIDPPGDLHEMISYKVLYKPIEPNQQWVDSPEYMTQENPIKVANIDVSIGKWYGSMTGTRKINAEIQNVEYNLNNNLNFQVGFNTGGGYASIVFREGRVQTIKLDRELRDYLLQRYVETKENFCLRILGESTEYEPGKKYKIDMIFPCLGIVGSQIESSGKILAEKGDFRVLEPEGNYPSAYVIVQNKIEKYAQSGEGLSGEII